MGDRNLQNIQLPNIGGVDANQFLQSQVGRIGGLAGAGGEAATAAAQPVDTRAIGQAASMQARNLFQDLSRQIQEQMVAGGKLGSSAQTGQLVTGGQRLASNLGQQVLRAGVGAAESAAGRGMQLAGLQQRGAQAQTGAGQDLLSLLGRAAMFSGGRPGAAPQAMGGSSIPTPSRPGGGGAVTGGGGPVVADRGTLAANQTFRGMGFLRGQQAAGLRDLGFGAGQDILGAGGLDALLSRRPDLIPDFASFMSGDPGPQLAEQKISAALLARLLG